MLSFGCVQRLAQESALEGPIAVVRAIWRDRPRARPRRDASPALPHFGPCAITGIEPAGREHGDRRRRAAISPVPAVGEVKACRGAVAIERRSSTVRIADKATERSMLPRRRGKS